MKDKITPSKYQKAIFTWVRNWVGVMSADAVTSQKRHLRVRGVAGCGKTSTIIMLADIIPPSERAVFLAFNKSIASKLKRKLPRHMRASTTHALGWRVCLQTDIRKAGDPTKLKTSKLLDDMQASFPERQVFPQVRKMVAAAKAIGLAPKGVTGAVGLVPDEREVWQEQVIDRFTLEFADDQQQDMAIDLARHVLKQSINRCHEIVDFDDMLYMPMIMQMPFPKFKWVIVDEAQDINAVQKEIVKRIIARDGHVIAVGDEKQAIYGFRGADAEAMNNIKRDLNADDLPLSICYRCAKAIVREAQSLCPTIEAAPDAPEGVISHGLPPGVKLAEYFTPDVSVLCPYNAPLVKFAFRLIREKIAVRVLGKKEIGAPIAKTLQKLGATTVGEAVERLGEYYTEKRAKINQNDEDKLQALQDRYDTLMVFLDDAPSNDTVDSVVARIEALFADRPDDEDDEETPWILTLSTIHKAKGLEWDKVVLLDTDGLYSTTRKGKPIPEWEIEQKMNLLYVGMTRPHLELVYLSSEQLERI